MGPRSIDRGIPDYLIAMRKPGKLQWGRDQLIAELNRGWVKHLNTWQLQWGRDQLIAEFRQDGACTWKQTGFNGAAIN